MKRLYGLMLFGLTALVLIAAAQVVMSSEATQSPVNYLPTQESSEAVTRLTDDYRASQTALRSAEASTACLSHDIAQLTEAIEGEGYTVTRVAGRLTLVPPEPKPRPAPEPVPQPKPQVQTDGWQTARASWYGPGFYGNKTASGAVLTKGMMNVAHRTLPFGTRIEFRYQGRTCVAVVNDRGPFVAGRTFDLGPGTAAALGFSGVQTLEWRRL